MFAKTRGFFLDDQDEDPGEAASLLNMSQDEN